ncbi:MAG: Cof-type HAD-IIB family hydrolase [Candidatus Fimenecus sp.]
MTKQKPFVKRHKELWKFIKFNISVLISSAIDILTYLVLLNVVFKGLNAQPVSDNALFTLLGIKYQGYLYAYLISTTLGYVAAYLMNRKLTFHSNVNPIYSSVLYFLLAVFNILVSSVIGSWFGTFITDRNLSGYLVEIISKFIIINIPTVWTYPLERYIIQIKKTEKKMHTILAVDLDGTLLNSNNAVSEENLSAISALKRKGVAVVPVTGRTLAEIPQELREHKDIAYMVYSNGAGIESREKGRLYYAPIDAGIAQKLFSVLQSYDTFIEIYADGQIFVDQTKFGEDAFAYYNVDAYFIPEMYKSRIPVENFETATAEKLKTTELFDVFFHSHEERQACKAQILQECPQVEITTSMDANLEIMNSCVNKGTGLQKLCSILGFDIKNTVAVGDSRNDLTLFQTVGKGFAVENACDALKAAAQQTICSNDAHVLQYMEKNIL